jgi:WD40 repeat protein
VNANDHKDFKAPEGMYLYGVKYFDEGNMLAASGRDVLTLWDMSTLTKKKAIQHDREYAGVFVSHDDTVLALLKAREILLLDSVTGGEINSLGSDEGDMRTCAFSPRDSILAVGTVEGAVLLCDVKKSPQDLQRFGSIGSPIECIEFSPNGKRLVLAGSKTPLQIWDVAQRKLLHKLDSDSSHAVTASFSHDGKLLASGFDKGEPKVGLITLWDTESWDPVVTWREPCYMQKAQFGSNGNLFVLTGASYVSVWDVPEYLEEMDSMK